VLLELFLVTEHFELINLVQRFLWEIIIIIALVDDMTPAKKAHKPYLLLFRVMLTIKERQL